MRQRHLHLALVGLSGRFVPVGVRLRKVSSLRASLGAPPQTPPGRSPASARLAIQKSWAPVTVTSYSHSVLSVARPTSRAGAPCIRV